MIEIPYKKDRMNRKLQDIFSNVRNNVIIFYAFYASFSGGPRVCSFNRYRFAGSLGTMDYISILLLQINS